VNILATHTFDVDTLPQWMAEQLTGLCRSGSEMQADFQAIADGHRHLVPSALRLCVASVGNEAFEMTPIAWVAASVWNCMQQLQGFVHEDYRQRHLATALASLVLLGDTMRDSALAVFSPEFERIGKSLGYSDVRQYKRVPDGWIRVEFADRRPQGDDEAGLHAPARPVRSVPLADETAGEVA
jgi:hypothetical protein